MGLAALLLKKRDQDDGDLGSSSPQYDYDDNYDDYEGYGESWWWSPVRPNHRNLQLVNCILTIIDNRPAWPSATP